MMQLICSVEISAIGFSSFEDSPNLWSYLGHYKSLVPGRWVTEIISMSNKAGVLRFLDLLKLQEVGQRPASHFQWLLGQIRGFNGLRWWIRIFLKAFFIKIFKFRHRYFKLIFVELFFCPYDECQWGPMLFGP